MSPSAGVKRSRIGGTEYWFDIAHGAEWEHLARQEVAGRGVERMYQVIRKANLCNRLVAVAASAAKRLDVADLYSPAHIGWGQVHWLAVGPRSTARTCRQMCERRLR